MCLSLSDVFSKKTKGAFKKGQDITAKMCSRSNSTKSLDSSADNISVPTMISEVGRMGEEVCALISVFLHSEQYSCQY